MQKKTKYDEKLEEQEKEIEEKERRLQSLDDRAINFTLVSALAGMCALVPLGFLTVPSLAPEAISLFSGIAAVFGGTSIFCFIQKKKNLKKARILEGILKKDKREYEQNRENTPDHRKFLRSLLSERSGKIQNMEAQREELIASIKQRKKGSIESLDTLKQIEENISIEKTEKGGIIDHLLESSPLRKQTAKEKKAVREEVLKIRQSNRT